jgi:hypothetical protein
MFHPSRFDRGAKVVTFFQKTTFFLDLNDDSREDRDKMRNMI